MRFVRASWFLLLSVLGTLAMPAQAQEGWTDPARVCDAAAARAEHDWSVPPGVLAAVGTVESGRAPGRRAGKVPWPWTINADGQGYFFASKAEAVRAASILLARGARFVDVGCFQVDLAFHGRAFASLEQAFDPEANAQAAARILLRGRLGEKDWAGAVARYHSASPVRGGAYLQLVRAAFEGARSRVASVLLDNLGVPLYAVLLSPAARRVRVLTAADPAPGTVAPPASTSRVLSRQRNAGPPEPQIIRLGPAAALPRVLIRADRP